MSKYSNVTNMFARGEDKDCSQGGEGAKKPACNRDRKIIVGGH